MNPASSIKEKAFSNSLKNTLVYLLTVAILWTLSLYLGNIYAAYLPSLWASTLHNITELILITMSGIVIFYVNYKIQINNILYTQLYNKLFEEIDLPVLICSPMEYKIMESNEAAAKLFGYNKDQLNKIRLKDLIFANEKNNFIQQLLDESSEDFIIKQQRMSGNKKSGNLFANLHFRNYSFEHNPFVMVTIYEISDQVEQSYELEVLRNKYKQQKFQLQTHILSNIMWLKLQLTEINADIHIHKDKAQQVEKINTLLTELDKIERLSKHLINRG